MGCQMLRKLLERLRLRKKPPAAPTHKMFSESVQAMRLASLLAMQTEHWRAPLAPEHRERFHPIFGDAMICNESPHDVVLEGAVLRRLVLKSGERRRIASPILQQQFDLRYRHKKIIEWDAQTVLKDMIVEYERAIYLGQLSGDESFGHYMPPDPMLIARSQLKAFRVRGMVDLTQRTA